MKRDLTKFANSLYDLLIIGGGIYGACLAWEASLRGLSVALVEKADFGAATSANSLKVIHGGLRYLQHADFKRSRQSICERKILLQIAPHLIHPMPVLIPTYGHGMKGREILGLGLLLNDLVGFDRNKNLDRQKHIPRGRTISREECLELLPGIRSEGLTGAAIFYDAQVYNSERLSLAFLQSAVQTGAVNIANYVQATDLLREGDRVVGAHVKDVLTGTSFDIWAKAVVNTAGPWINQVLEMLDTPKSLATVQLAKAINVVTRPLFEEYAMGISGQKQYQDADALINKGSRFFFIAPWRNHSMVGTEYIPYDGNPDHLNVTEEEIQNFLNEINQAYPPAQLKIEDVSFVHCGLVPISGVDPKSNSVQLAKHYEIRDHHQDGARGLLSVIGVKYTTARYVATRVVDKVFEMWDQKPPPSISAVMPLHGGEIADFEWFLSSEIVKSPFGLENDTIHRLIYNYGTVYREVLQYLDKSGSRTVEAGRAVLKAEILHGIRDEMAQTLADIVFRRTQLGTAGHPGHGTLRFCAEIMGAEFGWDEGRIEQELQEVHKRFWQSSSKGIQHATNHSDAETIRTELAYSAI